MLIVLRMQTTNNMHLSVGMDGNFSVHFPSSCNEAHQFVGTDPTNNIAGIDHQGVTDPSIHACVDRPNYTTDPTSHLHLFSGSAYWCGSCLIYIIMYIYVFPLFLS